MGESTPPPERPSTSPESSSGGINIQGGDVRAARDIVAGDVNVAGDSISGQTVSVQQGLSANQVQRLLLTVGGLVFVTAACFFVLGAISAAAVVNVLQRPLVGGSSPADAAEMQRKLQELAALQPGQQFQVAFSEDELSSYFRFIAGPRIGVQEGKVRLMDEAGVLALGGNIDSFGGLPFAAEVEVTTGEQPLVVRRAWLKVLPSPEGSSIGYVPVTPLVQSLNQQTPVLLTGEEVQFTRVFQTGGGEERPPTEGNNLILFGVAK
jgi:hypothetical protein